ncbi:MAG: hypothetical protein LC751_06930, partial [Actinobacteria bacterium]|nr:hypothetical protein [Actinomycetota bacterium]
HQAGRPGLQVEHLIVTLLRARVVHAPPLLKLVEQGAKSGSIVSINGSSPYLTTAGHETL